MDPKDPRQLRKSWEIERQSAHLYRIMTQVETDERKDRLFESLAEEEAEELALIFHARGVSMEEARKLGSSLVQDPQNALDTLAREELGLNPADLGSPWVS